METKLEAWSDIDIALAEVESPYDFNDTSFEVLCSYIPAPIAINYEAKYQIPGTDAIALGWGHSSVWRKVRVFNKMFTIRLVISIFPSQQYRQS